MLGGENNESPKGGKKREPTKGEGNITNPSMVEEVQLKRHGRWLVRTTSGKELTKQQAFISVATPTDGQWQGPNLSLHQLRVSCARTGQTGNQPTILRNETVNINMQIR